MCGPDCCPAPSLCTSGNDDNSCSDGSFHLRSVAYGTGFVGTVLCHAPNRGDASQSANEKTDSEKPRTESGPPQLADRSPDTDAL